MKVGFLSMPLTGHLHPMTALGRKMQARGHEVVFFGLPDAARIVHSAGLDFVPFGEEEYPVGTTPAMYARLATLKGEDVVRYSFREMHPRRARNLEAVRKMSSVFQPIQQVARSWAENHGLQIDWDTPNATISKLAVITQTPKEFDFPGVPQAPAFHYLKPDNFDAASSLEDSSILLGLKRRNFHRKFASMVTTTSSKTRAKSIRKREA